jgi:hypothetical protein
VTVALRFTVAPACKDEGGAWVKLMLRGGREMRTVAVTVLVASAVARALTFTAPLFPGGTEPGAVYVTGVPLALWAALSEPHFATEQLRYQSTPMFAGSFTTVAIADACVPICIGEGGT